MSVALRLKGFGREEVLDLPVPDFNDLYREVATQSAAEKVEMLHGIRAAVNAEAKEFESFVEKRWGFLLKRANGETNDIDRAVADFKKNKQSRSK